METGLRNKVVVITGAGGGIGRATAFAFAAEGCRIAICDIQESALTSVKQEIEEKTGAPVYAEIVDVSNCAALQSFADHTVAAYGALDVWINNAGIQIAKPFLSYTEADFDRLIGINLKSVFFGSQAAANYMRKHGGGVLLHTSSITAHTPTAGKILYGGIKAAIVNLTKGMAAELGADHIRVCSIMPAYTPSGITSANLNANRDTLLREFPMRRFAEPREQASVFVFLASDAASFINGESVTVGGGKLTAQNPSWCWEHQEP